MKGNTMTQQEIYDSKIPLSLRKNNLNIQIDDSIRTDETSSNTNTLVSNIKPSSQNSHSKVAMSVRGNKKFNLSLKMTDLNVIEEKENPS